MPKAAKRTGRRPFIDAAQAAELLGCDPRTVRKMVSDGRLEGAKIRSANDRYFEWRIFTDQPPIEQAKSTGGAAAVSGAAAPPAEDRLARENAELRALNAELRAERAEELARSAAAQNAQLAAALNAMTEVLGEFQKGGELAQRGAELAQQGNTHLQAGAATLSKVMSALLDTVALNSVPDSPEGIRD